MVRLEAAGVRRAAVTLHVGLGTFAPIRVDDGEPLGRVALELLPDKQTDPSKKEEAEMNAATQ